LKKSIFYSENLLCPGSPEKLPEESPAPLRARAAQTSAARWETALRRLSLPDRAGGNNTLHFTQKELPAFGRTARGYAE